MEKEVKETGEELNFLRKSQAQHARGKRSQKFSKAPNKPVASNAVQCKYCGRRQRHYKKEECPAFGQQCNKCHRYNHFQKMCLSESVDFAEEVDGNSSDDSVLHVEEITALKGKGKQLLASLTFIPEANQKEQVECLLDTGATCNVISYNKLTQLLQDGDPPLTKSRSKLKLFDGTLLQPVGEIVLVVERLGKLSNLKFQVVEGVQKPLLSTEACEQLELIKVDLTPAESVNAMTDKLSGCLTREHILTEYKDVFEGLGHIGDTKFVLDPSVQPVQHNPRRVPIAIQDIVRAKIADLEKKGIVKKVTKPTEWISSMVVVTTPKKIRICLDPKDLNKAVLRPKYQMAALDEVLPKLSKAKVFSTLDAKDGFYQVGLDEESSVKTTFWTPFGRYRFLRLPFGINLAPEEFECKLQEKLDGLPGVIVLRDDILVVGNGETLDEANKNHDENLVRLLDRARQVNLRLNGSKLHTIGSLKCDSWAT